MKNYNVLTQIVRDLKIYKVPNEKDNEYFARVIYSAISVWIKVSTFNNDSFRKKDDNKGINKHRNTIENRKILESMLELIPESSIWFESLNREEIIPQIRERLENIGDIVTIGNNLILPNKKSLFYNDRFNKSNVISNSFETGYISGIVWFQNDTDSDTFMLDYFTNETPIEFVDNIVKNCEWSKLPSGYDHEVFDSNSYNNFHQSWRGSNLITQEGIYLIRHRLESSLYDYSLVKKSGEDLLLSELSNFYRDHFEIYRIYYGISQGKGGYQTATIKLNNNVGVLILNDRLPSFEQNILRSICWPQRNIIDDYCFVFNKKVYSMIKSVLKRLNINIREVDWS